MKKIICLLLILIFIFSLAACDESDTATETPKTTEQTVDVDLTKLSSTMVYSEVNNMMTNPQAYMGKYVKMKGQFAVSEGEKKTYFACVIADATACCQQGIEFTLKESKKYPEEYPALGTEITVEGKFSTYKEDGQIYLELIGAKLET